MSISLIITKSRDNTGEQIELADWLKIIELDPDLRLKTTLSTARNPATSEVISVPSLPGQTELRIDNNYIPFLAYRRGKLIMKFTDDLNTPTNPARLKIVTIARLLGAAITCDAGDEILAW